MQFDSGGSKSKKMKLTVKGGAAVDPDSGKFVLHNRVIGTFSAAKGCGLSISSLSDHAEHVCTQQY